MTLLVESLKRLYFRGEVTSKKLNDMLVKRTITKEQYLYITENKEPC